MKNFKIFLLLWIGLCSPAFCDEILKSEPTALVEAAPVSKPSSGVKTFKPILEAKLGYFFFADSKMRKVYDHGGIDVQISTSYPVWRFLHIYGSIEYLTRWGKSLGSHEKTTLWEIPFSLGLKPVWSIHPKVQYYFAIGPRYVFLYTHNDSPYVDHHLSQNGIAGFVNTGFNFFPWERCCIDLFAEYSYAKLRFHPETDNVFGRNIQVGGFAFGIGAGYVF